MAGRLVSIIAKTQFESSNSTQITVGPRSILTTDWRSGLLSVRIHSRASWDSTAVLVIAVTNAFISEDDPSTLLVDPYENIAEIILNSANIQAGAVYTAPLDQPIGPMLAIKTYLNLGASSTACAWEMSIDLLGRDI
jgi:hypothetical protein